MLINFIEIFAIGFGLGLAGPCLFYCIPPIFAFTLGSIKNYGKCLMDICVFLCGRTIAYIFLAFLAGASGMLLHNFIGWHFASYLKPLAGLISIGLGIFILFEKENKQKRCLPKFETNYTKGSLFGLGFILGITPCAPLVALLSEITLISKEAFSGALYGLAFGLGTFIPAFLITAALAGIFKEAPRVLLKSVNTRRYLKITSSILLIALGLLFIAGSFTGR
ncbi:MAG: sulfite exporter TauE/SafE family protein [Candidatus Omnitrophica bacterium]|nr:sulfite exporter TauE/SafE family protein [Candidatus Omnitrophota bacterium]